MDFNIDRKVGEIITIDPVTIDSSISLTQIPGRYDPDLVKQYAELMTLGNWDFKRVASYPQLFFDEATYFIGDGHHTIDAAALAQIGSISCFVAPGSFLDAKIYSFRHANRFNGLSLSNRQKTEIVAATLADPSILAAISVFCGGNPEDIPSARAIATYLNDEVSVMTIGKLIAAAIADGSCPWLDTEQVIGKDGRSQPKKKGKKPEPVMLDEDLIELDDDDDDPNEGNGVRDDNRTASSSEPVKKAIEQVDRHLDTTTPLPTFDAISESIVKAIDWNLVCSKTDDFNIILVHFLEDNLTFNTK